MSNIEQYIHAATRDNTRRSYQSAVNHYEVAWGGFLPATSDSIARYLADHAETLAANTLQLRLSALAQWHSDQGFPDPTKAPIVKKVLKGIRELHPVKEKRARPLQLEELSALAGWLEDGCEKALAAEDRKSALAHARNRALMLLGFWRGFRSDELCRLQAELISVTPGQGMTIFLPRSKADRRNKGREFRVPALSCLCPVAAYGIWVELAGISEGPVFRGINRWGQLADSALTPHNLSALLRRIFTEAGLAQSADVTSHSLRRGFASWANANGWEAKTLMEYVGWKDIHSAMRYIEAPDPFSQYRIEQGLAASTAAQPKSGPAGTELEVFMSLTPYHKRVRTLKKAHEKIERFCLKANGLKAQTEDRQNYRITVTHDGPEHLEEILDGLLHQMYEIAQSHECILETVIRDPGSGRTWE